MGRGPTRPRLISRWGTYVRGCAATDLLIINDAITPAVGEITHLSGRLLDARGEPIRDAVTEIWQCDKDGTCLKQYTRDGDDFDTNFQGYGRFLTGTTGEYDFRTIKPVPYHGRPVAHIHARVWKGQKKLLTTECFIKRFPGNESDGQFKQIRRRDPRGHETLCLDFAPIKTSRIGEPAARWDIVLGYSPEARAGRSRRSRIPEFLAMGGMAMKRSLFAVSLVVGAAILAGGVRAQQPGRGGPQNPLLQAFDTDRDGTLSAAEIDAAAAKLRERDANKDGKLTADELPRGQGRGSPGQGRGGRGPGAMEADSDLSKPPLPKDDGEKRILAAIEQARQGERYANVSAADGRLLRQLAESIGARRIVELGTSTGESGLWWSLALRKTGGKLYTHDIDPGRIAVARENFKRAGVDDLIVITEGDAHQTAPRNKEPIDILFIDAEKEGYDAYLKELLPYVRPGGLIIAHNMRRPAPNPRYVEAITSSPDLDTSFVLMDGAGIGITLKKR